MRSTTIPSVLASELVLVAFPFTGGAQTKQRPALVILDTGDNDVVLARVTTQLHMTRFDAPIVEWRGAGLRASSVVRLHKLATLDRSLIVRRLGTLQPPDRAVVVAILNQIFCRP